MNSLKYFIHTTLYRYDVENFLDWLERTLEVDNLIQRAISKKKIIDVIAEEN